MTRNGVMFDKDDALTRFADEAKRVPMLTAERERKLGLAVRDHGDQSAREELVSSHLRLILPMSARMSGYGHPTRDLVSQGTIGLMKAVDRFDPDQPARFATYAIWWIRAELIDYVVRNSSVVRNVTSSGHRALFFRLRRAKERLGILHDGDLSETEAAAIASLTGTSSRDVMDMNRRIGRGGDVSIDARGTDARGEDTGSFIDRMPSNDPDPFEQASTASRDALHRDVVEQALATLTDRERTIITERNYLDDVRTLEELGVRYGLSRERIRQIEAKAKIKLQRFITSYQNDNRISLFAA